MHIKIKSKHSHTEQSPRFELNQFASGHTDLLCRVSCVESFIEDEKATTRLNHERKHCLMKHRFHLNYTPHKISTSSLLTGLKFWKVGQSLCVYLVLSDFLIHWKQQWSCWKSRPHVSEKGPETMNWILPGFSTWFESWATVNRANMLNI